MQLLAFLILCVTALWASPLNEKVELQKAGGRIINGTPASRGQFPWQAAVYFTTSSGTSFCGGSIISNIWILTAAHCAVNARTFTIYLGTITLNPDSGSTVVTTTNKIVHPNYNPSTLANDVALIRLDSAITFSTNIQAITLASSSLGSGVSVTVSGWGKTSDASSGVTNNLNYVTLSSITNAQCSQYYGSLNSGVVCATGSGKSTCNGDSGGPLITGSGSSAIQVGIVSFVSTRGCESGYPSGYARTHYYREWIRQQTGV
ncbi:hypothetical protein Zmor_018719 [Zophobas morio]|uniref:Peptidase S1 domain-containing protein n=1 Tax=Zophobas morio TaxID=2755281 RepID=A0AA38ICX1_9CUCU|nr:hypothetical protein Zmor_018719 [Zophobas morio]